MGPELEQLAQFVSGVEDAGYEVADCEVAVEPDTPSTVHVRIPLSDDVTRDADVRIEDATLVGDELRVTAAIPSTDETSVEADTTASTTEETPPPDTSAEPTPDASEEMSHGVAPSDTPTGETNGTPTSDDQEYHGEQPALSSSSKMSTEEQPTDKADASSDSKSDNKPASENRPTHTDDEASDDSERRVEPPYARDGESETNADVNNDDTAEGERAAPLTNDPDDGLPVHRDPEKLAAVYDSEKTFKEMTDALGADVTPQTVRKYMIEHGIHTPASHGVTDAAAQKQDASSADESTGADEPEKNERANESKPESGFVKFNDSDSSDKHRENTPAESNATDRGDASDTSHQQNSTPEDGRGEANSVMDIDDLRERVGVTNLPDGVTVDQLVDAVTRSRTVYEVRRQLNLENQETRQLLKRCELIDLVTGRITEAGTTPSEEVVIQRLSTALESEKTNNGDPTQSAS